MPKTVDAQDYAKIIYDVLTHSGMTPEQVIQAQFGELRNILREWVDADKKERMPQYNEIINNFRAFLNTLHGKFILGYFEPVLALKSGDCYHEKTLNDILQLFQVACTKIDKFDIGSTPFPDELFDHKNWIKELSQKEGHLKNSTNMATIASKIQALNEQLATDDSETKGMPQSTLNSTPKLERKLSQKPNEMSQNDSTPKIPSPPKMAGLRRIGDGIRYNNNNNEITIIQTPVRDSDSEENHATLYAFLKEQGLNVESILASQLFQLEEYLSGYQKIFTNNNKELNALQVIAQIEKCQNEFNQAVKNGEISEAFNALHAVIEDYLDLNKIRALSNTLQAGAAPLAFNWQQESKKIKSLFELSVKELPSKLDLIKDKAYRKIVRGWQLESENKYEQNLPKEVPKLTATRNNVIYNSAPQIQINTEFTQKLSAQKRKNSPSSNSEDNSFESGNRSAVYNDSNKSPYKMRKLSGSNDFSKSPSRTLDNDNNAFSTGISPALTNFGINKNNSNSTDLTPPTSPSQEDDPLTPPTPPYHPPK
ncbi:MAG: hypothetical protein K2Q14_03710 [Gammaproteobacteria bacterium]|nr:hypothetical protein [Gammaproteobacteria bacterium]